MHVCPVCACAQFGCYFCLIIDCLQMEDVICDDFVSDATTLVMLKHRKRGPGAFTEDELIVAADGLATRPSGTTFSTEKIVDLTFPPQAPLICLGSGKAFACRDLMYDARKENQNRVEVGGPQMTIEETAKFMYNELAKKKYHSETKEKFGMAWMVLGGFEDGVIKMYTVINSPTKGRSFSPLKGLWYFAGSGVNEARNHFISEKYTKYASIEDTKELIKEVMVIANALPNPKGFASPPTGGPIQILCISKNNKKSKLFEDDIETIKKDMRKMTRERAPNVLKALGLSSGAGSSGVGSSGAGSSGAGSSK